MATASSMIFNSLWLNGAKAIGGSFSSAEGTAYLERLNAMLESWSLERLMCYSVLQESFALSAGVPSYTIGSGATFNTARPTKIVDPCFIRDASNFDTPVQLINTESYGRFVAKGTSGSVPCYLYYDSAYVSGYGTISLYPPPMAGLTLFINSWRQLQNFSTITTSTTMPPGFQRAIEYNFAIEISGPYKTPSPEVLKIARDSKAAIKSLTAPDALMRLDYGIAGSVRAGESILTGG